jgi:hypothetical protein
MQHSPAPIGPGPPAKDAHIVGYWPHGIGPGYVLTDRPSATRIPSFVIHNPMPRLVSRPRFFKRETAR